MKLELHVLQNFAPSNLNRDDTGAPKDCEFGGYRRARVSSQCMKRAIREALVLNGSMHQDEMAARTKRLVEQISRAVAEKSGRDETDAAAVTRFVLEGAGLGIKEDDKGALKTEYLLFLPRRHIQTLASFVVRHWPTLHGAAANGNGASSEGSSPDGGSAKKGKKKADAKSAFPKELAAEVRAVFEDGTKSPDLALFGRMIADTPKWNVEAACQVAHAISTNRITMDFDFYTAVDDFRHDDTTGSDMMGAIQFNSACFYRYAVLDLDALAMNLGETSRNGDLARRTTEAFVRAFVLAVPTGKQNSMAAHNPPSYVLAMIREGGTPVSLANAFVKPVRPRGDEDLVDASIDALESYLDQVARMLGVESASIATCADRGLDGDRAVRIHRKGTLKDLVGHVMTYVSEGRGA